MDTELLVTEACSDASASDGEIRDPWNLPHVITITSSSESEEDRHDDRQAVIYVDIFLKFYIASDEMLLINRLSNRMKKCEQREEELLVKVLSPLRHHKGIIGAVHTASAFRTMEAYVAQ